MGFYEEPRLITTSMYKMPKFERVFNKYKLGWMIEYSSRYSPKWFGNFMLHTRPQ